MIEKRKLFEEIYAEGSKALADSGYMKFEDRLKNYNPSTYYGRASAAAVTRVGDSLESSRMDRDPAMLDDYLGDLDFVTQSLENLSGFTNESNRKVRSRADLRAMRRRAIDERKTARNRLQALKVDRVGEDVYFIDPTSGEQKLLTEDEVIAGAMPSAQPTRQIMNEAKAYFDEKYNEKVEKAYRSRVDSLKVWNHFTKQRVTGQGVSFSSINPDDLPDDMLSGRDLRFASAMADREVMSEMIGAYSGRSKQEQKTYDKYLDTAYQQTRTGFAQLAAAAVNNSAMAMVGELNLRRQAAATELEARKKANKTVTESERKRVQQVQAIDKSIQSINQTFAKADAQFLSSLTDEIEGVNFRADRPQ